MLIGAAIAISYFDRQTLPVAITAIQREIPISNTQFSQLQAAFLTAYALMYAGGGKLVDTLGTRRGFVVDHAVVVARLRQSRLRRGFRHAGGQPLPARHGRRRRISRRYQGGRRVVPRARPRYRDGHHQRRHRGRGGVRAPR